MSEEESLWLDRIAAQLNQMGDGQRVRAVAGELPESCSPSLRHLNDIVRKIADDYNSNYSYILGLSRGELDLPAPMRNSIANPYKQLQAELKHLTWQIDEISKGDLNQQVSFSGDFATAINRMIESLREKERIGRLNEQYLEELCELNAMKDKFFSIVAHDLKNPFSGLLGLSEILLDDLENNQYDRAVEYARLLKDSSKQGYKLLLNLLDWARLQTNSWKVNIEPYSLRSMLEESRGVVIEKALQKKIRLLTDLPDDFMLLVDYQMFQTVLRNLLTNALKFTPEGGSVTVKTERTGDRLQLSVCDTGVGIPADKVNQLFRIDSGFSTKGTSQESGTGLGLLLCHDFMKKMGGGIRVESQPGKGSTFTIDLPLAE